MKRLGLDEIFWGCLALAGVWETVKGLTAERFTDRTLGWLPGQERVKFDPKWYHRTVRVSCGLLITIYAFFGFIGVHWKR